MNAQDRKYISEFWGLKCAGQLLPLFPNPKEVTESFGCFHAVWEFLDVQLKNPDVMIVVVGDGTKPRTAATFALRSAWDCISIDPMMVVKDYGIKRLLCIDKKIEDTEKHIFENRLIIVLPHSHAKMPYVLNRLESSVRRDVVSLPCCVPHEIKDKHFEGYRDWSVWSEKNEFKIWKDV